MHDPVGPARLLRNARREALIVTAIWAAAFVYMVGYCFLFGYKHCGDCPLVRAGIAYPRSADNFSQVFGFPDWIFWGIITPWLVSVAVTVWFGLFGMADDDLGAGEKQS